ncbi:LysR family transcriptional regulator [Paraburkholderia caribensis]|jgi:molybdate transport repressor ModE-like protein|uniref:LysR family transcriptional regulator n=1 Tax=Paraburkholderia caribensis TaxID=75105 RepID=UPI001CB3F3E7|nr:LysR family transcriptional regulator [Paraburkholderia caribensis]CAG9234350.1 LysR family transcriptional regulator [Paraburkholderia caribensis]
MADQIRTSFDWEDIRIFVSLARYGSLSATARALSLSHATISRRIQTLEKALGEKLVERRPDGYVLTTAGVRALSPASEMEVAAARLGRGGQPQEPSGLVRVNAPPSLAQCFLVEKLAGLTAAYPTLDVDLATDFRAVSLERREADVALRFGRPTDGEVIAKRAATPGFGFYAVDEWRRRLAAGESPTFVGFDDANAHLPEASWLRETYPRARVAFKSNSQVMQAAAARAGAGIALLPHFVGRGEATLVHCEMKEAPPSRELWLLIRRDGVTNLAIKTVVDFLMNLLSSERALIE